MRAYHSPHRGGTVFITSVVKPPESPSLLPLRPGRAPDSCDEEKISYFKISSSTPARVRCYGSRRPVVSQPANLHRPFRAKSRNCESSTFYVMIRYNGGSLFVGVS